jgi:hypothetical protein
VTPVKRLHLVPAKGPDPAVCGEEHPMLCSDEEGEVPLVCGLPRGHSGEHCDARDVLEMAKAWLGRAT